MSPPSCAKKFNIPSRHRENYDMRQMEVLQVMKLKEAQLSPLKPPDKEQWGDIHDEEDTGHSVRKSVPVLSLYPSKTPPTPKKTGRRKATSLLYIRRRPLWHELSNMNPNNLPWLVMGDFNAYLSVTEKKGGLQPTNAAMADFRDAVSHNHLIEASSTGFLFTWTNKQKGNKRIRDKIDKIFMNSNWIALFPGWQYKVLSRFCSDHSPLELQVESLLEQEAVYWKQRSRTRWDKEVDRSTKYYHNLVNIRKSRAMIKELQDYQGNMLTEQEEINNFIVSHYT
ncbi:hypothetical protein IFM89_025507 [Coptis chinensis]|uniref:Endonuclease/exonuclease/phosphatase domain-containing protein n=1 Tax=Coptis chinensis TaxID=261450 RepID=A0A835LFP2_9MAGN|nr:hypothetical protein IFM89_025507 [Coptis chinensis]